MIYLDHASSSQVEPQFIKAAQSMLPDFFANPNSQHMLGYEVNSKIDASRKQIAQHFKVRPQDVIFTGSGSEAMNLAIKGVALANLNHSKHIISVKTEHHSVLNSLEYLKQYHDFEISYLEVDQVGHVDLDKLKTALRPNTSMVVMMAVNNEIATIHPLEKIHQLIKQNTRQAVLVVDAVAAIGKIDFNLIHGDVIGMSAHKLGGFAGSGCLIKKQHVLMEPVIHGGQQEQGLRGGTPFAIANILWGAVFENALVKQKEHKQSMAALRDYAIAQLRTQFDVTIVSDSKGSPYIVSFIQKGMHSSVILNTLSMQGVYVSSHSACASQSQAPSHVLLACHYPKTLAQGMIRISFNYKTTQADIDGFLKAYQKVKMYEK
ncbi:MAG: cysteine desulfurase [Erysipelothrix sp.]|nr:cysteine desulfurase [Erysipelothrix sp.]